MLRLAQATVLKLNAKDHDHGGVLDYENKK